MSESPVRWWGEVEFADGDVGYRQVGPLRLWVTRLAREWRVASENLSDPFDPTVLAQHPATEQISPASATVQRFVARPDIRTVIVEPQLADRAVVSRPDPAIHILPGDRVTLFLSTPLWVRLRVGTPPAVLSDLPTVRPSDTWFGPSRQEGELCYASRTQVELELRADRPPPARVLTSVSIHHRGDTPLLLERLKLPAPLLSVFADTEQRLWTEGVSFEIAADGTHTEMRLTRQAPAEAGEAELVSEPRLRESRNILRRALSAMFG